MVCDQERERSAQWVCIEAVASKIGCTPQTMRTLVRQAEVDQGRVDGVTNSDSERRKALERELQEGRANEFLRKASVYVA